MFFCDDGDDDALGIKLWMQIAANIWLNNEIV